MASWNKLLTISLVFLSSLFCAALSGGCPSYCDASGHFVGSQSCSSDKDEFCCGDLYNRYCCNNETERAPQRDNEYICRNSSWWIFQSSWQVALGMLGTIIILLTISAFCCKLCGKAQTAPGRNQRTRNGANRRSRSDVTEDLSIIDIEGHGNRTTPVFDPDSPFAFQPPSYEDLPKDPPPYMDLFDGGIINSAFQVEEAGTSSNVDCPGSSRVNTVQELMPLPPSYSQLEGSRVIEKSGRQQSESSLSSSPLSDETREVESTMSSEILSSEPSPSSSYETSATSLAAEAIIFHTPLASSRVYQDSLTESYPVCSAENTRCHSTLTQNTPHDDKDDCDDGGIEERCTDLNRDTMNISNAVIDIKDDKTCHTEGNESSDSSSGQVDSG